MEVTWVAPDKPLVTVSGALTESVNILWEYYKSESKMYRRRASKIIKNSTRATTLQADTYIDEL